MILIINQWIRRTIS